MWRLEDAEGSYSYGFQWYPCLSDRAISQSGYNTYFFQDTWAARQVFKTQPCEVVDIGSTVLLVGIISQFVPVTSIDIRPIISNLEGLQPLKGTITSLPFDDESIEYVQSMCVIEHIGLGRYGDPIDFLGTQRAVAEVKRVICSGGHFVFSVPLGSPCIAFNAHRIFSKNEVLSWFDGWNLVDELLIDSTTADDEESSNGYIGKYKVGCFHFKK
jgi:SAM-dependent methyltransferase